MNFTGPDYKPPLTQYEARRSLVEQCIANKAPERPFFGRSPIEPCLGVLWLTRLINKFRRP